jgi:hypothetical protein
MEYSEQFQQEKENEIKKIEKQNQFVEKLQQANLPFLSSEENAKLHKIYDKNKTYHHKLSSNEFEIAIVGLEKAGKSTFANALIGNNVLPSAPERCTFTSTRLSYGNDTATVEFYTEKEFNDIFIELLKDIKYPDAEKQHFKIISLSQFESYFNSLEQSNLNLYKNHIGKTDEEIKDIINVRSKLRLDGGTITFSGNQLLTDEFQAYIKGENKGKDTSKPRSVKRVEVKSSKLQKLDSAIIYDVPGFDSPTKIHERQTIERLKSADAIILITNVGRNPSLVGTQLNIITNNSDADGIPLRDKLFVFGNQLDMANDKDESERNKNTLRDDVQKYKIAEQKRVFTGSALKYLLNNNIIEKPDFKFNYEINSGIDEIYNELVNYYENERFEILKRKIDANRIELKEILENVLKNGDSDFDPNFAENEKHKISRETAKRIEKNIEDKLKKLKLDLKKEIWENKYFTDNFKKQIEAGEYFKEITEEEIKSAKRNEDDSLTLDTPIERMNQSIRNKLHPKFLEEYIKLIRRITDEKSKEINNSILETFITSIIGNETVLPDTKEMIKKESEKVIEKLSTDIAHNDGRFLYLIERFSRDIFDILISNPLITTDRKNKFREAEMEFSYLDNYYENGNGSLLSMLLVGEKKSGLENIKELGIELLSLVSSSSGGFNVSKKMDTIREVATKINNLNQNNSKINIDEIIKDKKRSETEDEVLNEINRDIENLKDILKIAVVPATNLDLVFFNSIDKEIKLLIDSCKNIETENGRMFNEFISKVIPKIKESELSSINQKLEEYKLQQEILKEIKSFEF